MSKLSDQAFAWIVAIGTSGALFGSVSFFLVKSARKSGGHHVTHHSDSNKHDQHSEHSGDDVL